MSVSPVIVARMLDVPVFVHEFDLSMDLANKIAYKFAATMYTTFGQTEGLTKAKHVGATTKVGNKIGYDDSGVEEIEDHFDPNLKTLLLIDGFAGARVFDDFITNTPKLTRHFNIVNISGDKCLNGLNQNLYHIDCVTDPYQPLMDMADVVATRGGSNAIFELVATHKLHLIVPPGKEAGRGDQSENTACFGKKGYARQLTEEKLTFTNPERELTQLFTHEDSYQTAMVTSDEIKP